MSARPSRLDLMLRSPREIRLHEEDDLRLFEGLSEPDRAGLRAVARAGAIEDRSKAVVMLVRLRDEAAAEVLAALLSRPASAAVIVRLRFLDEAADGYLELVTPWLLNLLDSADPALRHEAALTCGSLRVAAAGPRLVELVRAANAATTVITWHSMELRDLAHAAARAWPSREVVDELRRVLERFADLNDPLGLNPPPISAVVEVARRGESDARAWALRWCVEWLGWRGYEGGDTADMADALVSCGTASVPLLENVIQHSPHGAGAGCALKVLAALDPDRAEHYARQQWQRFPSYAVAVLAARYQATEAADVVALVDQIASRLVGMERTCAEALMRIGGPDARRAAANLVERLAARERSSPELPALRSLVAAAASARDIADEMVSLGLASSRAADEAVLASNEPHPWDPWRVTDIALRADAPVPASPYSLMVDAFERDGRVVSFDWNAGVDPPCYDEYLANFVRAGGGAVSVDDIELIEEDDVLRLSFSHRGERHSWEMDSHGDMYLLEILPLAELLKPDAKDDPRRFVPFFANTYVFADPEKVRLFANRFGIPES